MQQQRQQTARRSASSARRFLKKNVGIALAVTATAAVLGVGDVRVRRDGTLVSRIRCHRRTDRGDVRLRRRRDPREHHRQPRRLSDPVHAWQLRGVPAHPCAGADASPRPDAARCSSPGRWARRSPATSAAMTAPSTTACGPGQRGQERRVHAGPGRYPSAIAALPAGAGPDGLAIDPAGRTLYIADSFKATIWSVPVSGGSVTPWLTDAALAPVPTEALPIGANGLRFHNGALWVSNFNKGTLLRVPVTGTGAAGPIRLVASGLPNIDDLSFLTPAPMWCSRRRTAPPRRTARTGSW